MRHLLIEQRSPEGLLKTWKLRCEQGGATFGTSKHADLRSPDPTVKGIQGRFEYRSNEWYYLNLELNSPAQGNEVEICLSKATDLKIGNSVLQVMPFDSRSQLFKEFDRSDLHSPAGNKKPYQFFIVTNKGSLLETQVVPLNSTFISKYDVDHVKYTPQQSSQWVHAQKGDFQVSQRTVYLDDISSLRHIGQGQMIDQNGKRMLYGTLAGAALLALLFMLSPESQDAGQVANNMLPPKEYREMKMTPPKKKKVVQQQAQAPAAQVAQTQPAPAESGNNKTLSAIKSLGASRISQLIGKVSAGAAKSTNVVVTNGVAAGTAPTGRALAAVGAIAQSGKDWSTEIKGTGVTVSTAGVAGGRGVAGMGGIGAGKTGTSGAELLEEEGEIVGGLDREIIAQYIKSQLGQILYCYERQLSANPDLYGKVAVRFTIGASGSVETQRIGESSLKNATVEGCILQRVAKWKFPTPEGGTKVNVTYPFLFKSTN
ncbi:MAG: hypothetical protein BroJett040_23370 [Oligoflexia bacterium]|nr:MAG: hypothetical protein BroJett040_23370 [Oligoflexia bacterium]